MNRMLRWVPALLVLSGFPANPPAWTQEAGKTTFGGFVDMYYAYSFQGNPTRTRAFTTQPLRHNEFNLNLGIVDVKHQSESVRGRFALQTGTYVESNFAAEPALLKHILEASIGTRIGEDIWVDFGIFPSHIGFEGILSKDNWTYTRSILADYSPYYETGVSITVALSENVFVRGLILNGWQNIAETNDDKAFGTQLQYKPSDQLLLNWSTFVGNEMPDSVSSRLRLFCDLYGIFTLSEHWSLALVFDAGAQKRPATSSFDLLHAGAVMVRRTIDERWSIAARIEYYSDGNGLLVPTGTPNNVKTVGGSVNLDFAPAPNMLWRVEMRTLRSKDAVYPTLAGFQNIDGFVVFSAAMSF
jgi:hypothetical protein